jgi:hypothetical protein
MSNTVGLPSSETKRVQFNKGGELSSDSTFTFDPATKTLGVTNLDVSGTATGVGGSGTPAGDDTQIQVNDGGAFGAVDGFTIDAEEFSVPVATSITGPPGEDDYAVEIITPEVDEFKIGAPWINFVVKNTAATPQEKLAAVLYAFGNYLDNGTWGGGGFEFFDRNFDTSMLDLYDDEWRDAQGLKANAIAQRGMQVNGPMYLLPVAFSALPAAASGLQGSIRAVTDSTTVTWGATITGGGSNHVLAYCNGSAWTVMAK